MAVLLLTAWMSLGLLEVCECLQWSSSATLQDKVTIPACAGQDVTLAWDYTHTAEEHVMDVEWRYRASNGSDELVLATEINGHFFTDESLEYIPGAGIRLLSVKSEDSGTYTVHVNLNLHGSVVTHVQTAEVAVTEASITTGGTNLQAHLQGATFLNTTQQHHLILVCGNVNPLWTPRVSIVWTTPENKTVPSTYEQNGQFALAVPNPFISGEYTCKIDNSSPASLCIPSDSPLRRGATVLVDGIEGRPALMDSEMKMMAKEIQTLRTEKDQMIGEIHTLEAEKTQMATKIENLSSQVDNLRHFSIRLVNGNDAFEGRVEIRLNGLWGTVCDDNWGKEEAKVVCRQLGLPTANAVQYQQAHFGQGSGTISRINQCLGTENYLLDCRFLEVATLNCRHREDVGVRCA